MVDCSEKPVWRRKLSRADWLQTLLERIEPGCEIGMEACGGAHLWARQLQAHGHTVKLVPPQFVKPYVKSNKNNANDAEAICEAMSRPNMRFVAVKTVEQQDIQAVHRIRAELLRQRTAKGTQIRGLCLEYGLAAPRELMQLRAAIPYCLEDQKNGLSSRFRRLLTGLWEDLLGLDTRLKELDAEITRIAEADPVAKRLQQLRGVGPTIATAMVSIAALARRLVETCCRNRHQGYDRRGWRSGCPDYYAESNQQAGGTVPMPNATPGTPYLLSSVRTSTTERVGS